MLRINQLKLPVGHTDVQLTERIRKLLRLKPDVAFSYEIAKKSIDARKKPELYYVYSILVTVAHEEAIVKRLHNPSVILAKKTKFYRIRHYL